MKIQPVSFKNTDSFSNFLIAPVGQATSAPPIIEKKPDSISSKNLKLYAAVASVIVALGVIVLKGKSIKNLFLSVKKFVSKKFSNAQKESPAISETSLSSAEKNIAPELSKVDSDAGRNVRKQWNEITEKLDEYTKSHPRKERTRMEWEEIHKMNRELQQLKQEARGRNVSLLEKKELEAGSREMEEYIKSRVLPLMSINEATAQDCLEMFVKYGKREVLPDASCSNDPLFNTINQMTQNIISCMKETEVSEKLPLKYLEVMEKYAKRDAVYFRDNDTLLSFIRECGEKLGAGTVERSIEILKGLVYQKRDYTEAKGYVQSLSREVKENEGVKRALRELEEAVKDLPENVPFQPVA